MLKKFVSLVFDSGDLNRVQANIESAIGQLLNNPVLDYNIVRRVDLAIGNTFVDHKLNRIPQGYFIVRQRGAANIYDQQDVNPTPKQNFLINSDAVVSVDIYFF